MHAKLPSMQKVKPYLRFTVSYKMSEIDCISNKSGDKFFSHVFFIISIQQFLGCDSQYIALIYVIT